MKQINNEEFYILAANGREEELLTQLNENGLSYKEVSGVYKGISERSFLIIEEIVTIEPIIRQLARDYSQECYLKLDADRNAYLVYPMTLNATLIGKFQRVSQREALDSDAYTIDPQTGEYYLAK